MTSANERQVAGSHYQAKTQHWDYAVQALDNRYLEGNITKYVVRHRKKNGLQDLEKALHYADKLIEEFTAKRVGYHVDGRSFDVHGFCVANGLNSAETFIVKRLAHWDRLQHLHQVKFNITILINDWVAQEQRMEAIKAGAIPASGYTNQDR